MLVSISGAKNILEIGALGGYSGICLARGFGREGKFTSLVINIIQLKAKILPWTIQYLIDRLFELIYFQGLQLSFY